MVFLIVGILGNLSAQMTLFKGTFDEAIKKARKRKKICSWTSVRSGAGRAKLWPARYSHNRK